MKAVMNSLTRYHTFNLAKTLDENDLLSSLVTAYPKSHLGNWSSMQDKVKTSYFSAFLWTLMRKGYTKEALRKLSSIYFDSYSSRQLEPSSDVVFGLSSFMLYNIEKAKLNSIKSIVDHGSLHLSDEKASIEKECEIFGFKDEGGDYQRKWLVERVEKEFELCDHIFVCSKLAKESLSNNGVEKNKIFNNPLGVDLSKFYSIHPPTPKFYGKFKILCVGSLIPRKGLHRLIQTLAHRDFANVELTLVGNSNNKNYVRYLKKIKNVSINFLGSFPESELCRFYNETDLFILPSVSDGWGMVTQQAIACGSIVLISKYAGSSEVIENNVNGFTYDPYIEGELAAKLDYIMSNHKYVQQKVYEQSINNSSLKDHSWDEYSKRLVDWVNENI